MGFQSVVVVGIEVVDTAAGIVVVDAAAVGSLLDPGLPVLRAVVANMGLRLGFVRHPIGRCR